MTDSVLLPLLLLGQLRNCLFSDWIFHKMRSLCAPSPSLYFSLAVSLYCCLHYLIASPFRPVGNFTRKRQHYANWINIVQFLMKCSAKFWPTFVVRCDAMSREKLATIGHTREVRKADDNCRQHLLKIVLLSRVCVWGKLPWPRGTRNTLLGNRRLQLHSLSAFLLTAYKGRKR